ncbi:MAG: DUF3179 domain-containing protein [Actinomycetia bacterium]|nr:DUF3179 domain-containing protein [Actinomycetes bacterium]
MPRLRMVGLLLAFGLLAAACSSDDVGSDVVDAAGPTTTHPADDDSSPALVESGEGNVDPVAACAPSATLAGTGSSEDLGNRTADTRQGFDGIGLAERGPEEEVLSAIRNHRSPEFSPLVDLDLIIQGASAPDAIRPIDDPLYLCSGDIDFFDDSEPVIAIELNGDARAYPLGILINHEIVNDVIGGVPVTVTYCPLCNSAIAYQRQLGDRLLDFGTSGFLYQSALVMYDRQTGTMWTHYDGRAVVGHLEGEQLEFVPVSTVSWRDWRTGHPESLVLSPYTGFGISYGLNPYVGYDNAENSPRPGFYEGDIDDRLLPKERVVGIARGGESAALPSAAVAAAGVTTLELGGSEVAVWHQPGASSALAGNTTSDGPDVGAVSVFEPLADDGRALTFERTSDGFVDAETGTTWNIFGIALDGPLEGERLTQVAHLDTFWFSWITYNPETRLVVS